MLAFLTKGGRVNKLLSKAFKMFRHKVNIIFYFLIFTIALNTFTAQSRAEPKTAKCFLTVNGLTYINGVCSFEFQQDQWSNDGSFYYSDMKQLTRCKNSSQKPGQCSVAETVIVRDGIFGQLQITSPGKGILYWNQGVALQAGQGFTVARNGACWENSRVKLCAYK